MLLLGAGGVAAWRWQQQRAASLAGRWRAYIGARGANTSRDGEVLMVEIKQDGKKLLASSSTIDVEHARDWQNHRDYWKQRFGKDLKQVFYKGTGEVLEADDDRRMRGRLWVDSERAERVVELRREP